MDEILDTMNPNHVILNYDPELRYFVYSFTAGYTLLLLYLIGKGCLNSPRSLLIVE
jgi:hypothetical protein